MSEPLVSVITPCFNGEKFVHRLFDSLLEQTYKRLEIIFVNDGSNDQTETIVKSYIPKFEELGMKFIYLYQDNQGQAAALNNGLKYFTGEYLTWPDSDDYYNVNSIEEFLIFFNQNPNFQIVRCATNLISEESGEVIGRFKLSNHPKSVFDDCLFEHNFWYCPISFMVKSQAFLETNPAREIFISRGGQNWQMMLPLLYKFNCGYISLNNANYLVRRMSHSRELKTFEVKIQRRLVHKEILLNTFKKIHFTDNDFVYYHSQLEDKYNRIFYKEYLRSFHLNESYKYFKQVKKKEFIDYLYPVIMVKSKILFILRKFFHDSYNR